MKDFINRHSGLDVGYFEMLDKIDAVLIEPTERNFDEMYKRLGCRAYWIRHDIDERIDKAWEMALEEKERGIYSVYFFLNTAAYFRWGAFIKIASDFVKLGHTIGFHNNCVAAAFKMNDPKMAGDILKRDIEYLRKAGPVWITASHGDIWCRHHNVTNYEMFSECKRNGKGSVLNTKPLAEYGLKYEAYFTPHDFYMSDSGGKWSVYNDFNVHREDFEKFKDPGNPFPAINAFNNSKTGVLQLLVHPQWWEPKP